MYSPQIINRNLSIIQATGGPPDSDGNPTPLPFQLTYHSLAYRRQCTSHLSDLINKDLWRDRGKLELKRPLALDEIQFIENERLLCTFDYLYFCAQAKILYWDGKGVDYYIPSKAQLIINDVRAFMEEKGVGIFLQQLKTRQVGASTDDQVAETQRLLFHSNTRALTASSKEDKTRELAQKAGIIIENMAWFLLPTIERKTITASGKQIIEVIKDFKIYDSGEVYFTSGELNTQVRLQYGNQTGGVGRGETSNFVHITEIPDWLSPKEDIQNSLLKSLHNTADFFFVAESTGKYEDDYWNEWWKDSEENYFKGLSRFYPLFLGWYIADDIYPTLADERAYMPSDFKPQPETELMSRKAEEFVHSNKLLSKHLGKDWKMQLRQKWFYEWDKDQARREKRLATWLCEMPSNPSEAFAIPGTGLFDAEFIQSLRAKASNPEFIFGLASPNYDIPYKLTHPSNEIIPDFPTIPIRATWSTNSHYNYDFSLIPLQPTSYTVQALSGRILIWEMPDEDEEYEIGIDCGEGVMQDYTSLSVIKRGDYLSGTVDKIVCTYFSNLCSASNLFPFALAIGTLYSTVRHNQIQQPKMVIERPKGGSALILELIKAGWKNFFASRLLATKQVKDSSERLGWNPTQQQRDDLLSEFLRAIEEGDIECYCPFFIKCLATLGYNPNRRRIEAISGHHDDAIFSSGMSYFSLHSFNIKGHSEGASQRREAKRLALLAQQSRLTYDPGAMARPVRAARLHSYWDVNK